MNDYNDRIDREKELNEIIKERIEAQSLALSNDVEALETLQGILLGADGAGLSGFFESLVESGIFNLTGVGSPGEGTDVGVPTGTQSPSIVIENFHFSGAETAQGGADVARGIVDYAEPRGITTIIKNRK